MKTGAALFDRRPPRNQTGVYNMFPQSVFPRNPFTGNPVTIGAAGAFSQGNIGYSYNNGTGIYVIEGYGETNTSGENGDGVVHRLSNG